MTTPHPSSASSIIVPSRRRLLRSVGALGLSAVAGVGASQVLAAGKRRPIKLAWNANAVCLAPVPVAITRGIFEKNGLDVELINYTGSTDQLLESIATSKADAGVGMIHRWIKPLESGFDVKLVSSSHGGCTRLVGYGPAGVTSLQKLKGKTILVGAGGRVTYWPFLKAKYGYSDEQLKPYTFNLAPFLADKNIVQQGFVSSEPYAMRQAGASPVVMLIADAGFILSSALLFACTARCFGSERPLKDFAAGVLLAAVAYFGFSRGLGINIGAGPIEALF